MLIWRPYFVTLSLKPQCRHAQCTLFPLSKLRSNWIMLSMFEHSNKRHVSKDLPCSNERICHIRGGCWTRNLAAIGAT